MVNEIYHYLAGSMDESWTGNLLGYQEGDPSTVDFDYEEVYWREDNFHDIIGFYHTHPNSKAYPSTVDIPTMQAWVECLGKDLICVIEGVDDIRAFLFSKNSDFKEVIVVRDDEFLSSRKLSGILEKVE